MSVAVRMLYLVSRRGQIGSRRWANCRHVPVSSRVLCPHRLVLSRLRRSVPTRICPEVGQWIHSLMSRFFYQWHSWWSIEITLLKIIREQCAAVANWYSVWSKLFLLQQCVDAFQIQVQCAQYRIARCHHTMDCHSRKVGVRRDICKFVQILKISPR